MKTLHLHVVLTVEDNAPEDTIRRFAFGHLSDGASAGLPDCVELRVERVDSVAVMPAPKPTPEQKRVAKLWAKVQALHDAHDIGLKRHDGYSGRGMGGRESPLAFRADCAPGTHEAAKLMKLGFQVDTLGLGWIYYLHSMPQPRKRRG